MLGDDTLISHCQLPAFDPSKVGPPSHIRDLTRLHSDLEGSFMPNAQNHMHDSSETNPPC